MPQVLTQFIIWLMLALLIALVVLSFYYWKRLSVAFKYLTYFLCLGLFVELLTTLLMPYKVNNMPILHVYTLLEFILSALLYQKMGLFDRWPTKRFWIFVGGVSVAIVLNSIFIQSILTHPSISRSLVHVLVISFSVGYMFQLKENTPESGALNIMNAAMLIVNTGSLFIFMFGNVLLGNEFEMLFWEINLLLNLIFLILILISIWKASRVRTLQF